MLSWLCKLENEACMQLVVFMCKKVKKCKSSRPKFEHGSGWCGAGVAADVVDPAGDACVFGIQSS